MTPKEREALFAKQKAGTLTVAERTALARDIGVGPALTGATAEHDRATDPTNKVATTETVVRRIGAEDMNTKVLDVGVVTEDAGGAEVSGVVAAAGATAVAALAAERARDNPTDKTAADLAEANAALDDAGRTSLKEKLAEALAKTSSPAAAGVTTGTANATSMRAINAAQLANDRAAVPIVPVKTSSDQVLFKTAKHSLGSATPNSKRFTFAHGYLLTSDPDIIAYVRENADLWLVTEEGSTPPKPAKTVK